MKVLEKSLKLLGRSYWEGAEVLVGEKLLIWNLRPLTYQLPQYGVLIEFSKLATKYQYLNTLIAFLGKVTSISNGTNLIFMKTSYSITYVICLGRFLEIFGDEHVLK